MQADAEITLRNLHVISALSQNDKLITNDDYFDVYTPTTLRSLYRSWYKERRQSNILRLRQTVRNGIAFVKRTSEDINALIESKSVSLQMQIDIILAQHLRMRDALHKACTGLRNMMLTYREDANIVSQLSLILDEITDFNVLMEPRTESLKKKTTFFVSDLETDEPDSEIE